MINQSRLMSLVALASMGAVSVIGGDGDRIVVEVESEPPAPTQVAAPKGPTPFDLSRIERAEMKRARKSARLAPVTLVGV